MLWNNVKHGLCHRPNIHFWKLTIRGWGGETAFAGLPEFHRDVFDDLYAGILRLQQMISVTGPRRVGKSTLLRQCIKIRVGYTMDVQLLRFALSSSGQVSTHRFRLPESAGIFIIRTGPFLVVHEKIVMIFVERDS